MDKKATLAQDEFSCFGIQDKDRKPYGKRGEEVKVISESLPALIVENKRGERFPVHIDKVNFKTT